MISNLEYYKVFYTVAKEGSLTKAARELHISQPAVSQALKQLETQLDTVLFVRASRGVHLTPEGELLSSYVQSGLEQLLHGEAELMRRKNMEVGEVRIGASDMTLEFFLLPYLERFHEHHPEIKVLVTNGPTPETLQYLTAGKIDFGLVSSPDVDDPHIRAIPVREVEDVFVCGRRFLPYKNKTLDLKELEHLPIISLEQNTSSRRYMDQFLSENGVTIQPEFELAGSNMIVQFAERNLGVGCVARDFAEQQLKEGTLFALRFNQLIPKRHFSLVSLKNTALSVAAQNLVDLILETR
ncbi:MAG: LysR family transcriptional regulator [Lachnospiraceae bacterium]|nr:LysR family transcriptional regulator [Lachnospiraceae bacterium]